MAPYVYGRDTLEILISKKTLRKSGILRIYEGTTQIMQLQIAKHMLREFASDGAVWWHYAAQRLYRPSARR